VRLLLDNCFSRRFAQRLRARGHDVFWIGDLGPDPGDRAILARAFAEQRVLITPDKDFGKLIFYERQPHAGLIRIRELTIAESLAACFEALELYGQELAAGGLVVGGPNGLRLRRAGEPE
jgi:predicted nuclease of predicted toxin-antitoxin system